MAPYMQGKGKFQARRMKMNGHITCFFQDLEQTTKITKGGKRVLSAADVEPWDYLLSSVSECSPRKARMLITSARFID